MSTFDINIFCEDVKNVSFFLYIMRKTDEVDVPQPAKPCNKSVVLLSLHMRGRVEIRYISLATITLGYYTIKLNR